METFFKNVKNGNDEYYTPIYAITPILKYLKPHSSIWCPFDTDRSNYVKLFKANGFNVINTHLEMGIDFFKCEVPQCDYIISNQPYSLKTEDGEILFCGVDVARMLGYSNTRDAIIRHCKHVVKHDVPCKSGTYTDKNGENVEIVRMTTLSFIPESDLYRLKII